MSTNLEPGLPLPPRTKAWRHLFLLVAAGIGLYFLLPQIAPIEHALRVAATLRISFVILSLMAQSLSYLGSGYLLRAVVRLIATPVSTIDGALITMGANSVGTLGGGVLGTTGMTYRWLRQEGITPEAAGLGGWIPVFLNDAMLAIVSLAGLLVFFFLQRLSGVLITGFALALVILAGGLGALLWVLTHREKLTPVAAAIAKVTAKLRRKPPDPHAIDIAVSRLVAAWDALVRGGWRAPATGAFLNLAFDILTLGFLFVAAGHGVNPLVLIAGYGVPQLLGKLTVILGGVGVVETTMVGLYGLLGVPTAVSVVVVLVYRLVSFWLPTLAGVALLPYFERRERVANKAS